MDRDGDLAPAVAVADLVPEVGAVAVCDVYVVGVLMLCTPRGLLAAGMTYRGVLGEGAVHAAGRPVPALEWTFTVRSAGAPGTYEEAPRPDGDIADAGCR